MSFRLNSFRDPREPKHATHTRKRVWFLFLSSPDTLVLFDLYVDLDAFSLHVTLILSRIICLRSRGFFIFIIVRYSLNLSHIYHYALWPACMQRMWPHVIDSFFHLANVTANKGEKLRIRELRNVYIAGVFYLYFLRNRRECMWFLPYTYASCRITHTFWASFHLFRLVADCCCCFYHHILSGIIR